LILAQRRLVRLPLVVLVIKILDRFVIQQTIGNPPARLVVESVHILPELGPPLGDADGEPDVRPDRGQYGGGVADPELIPHAAGDDAHLDDGGDGIEDHGVQDEGNASISPFDDATERAGISIEVELHVEGVDVIEGRSSHGADGGLRDVREDGVSRLLE